MERQKIIDICANGNIDELKPHDQLLNQMEEGNCFVEFKEGEIKFKPTYRFDRGTREWSDEKSREPAWCDRVLWKTANDDNVKLLEVRLLLLLY